MSQIAATAPFVAPRWYVTGALPEPVKTAHLTERDPEDRRYARSVCGTERARLWDSVDLNDSVDVMAADNAIEMCFECASTLSVAAPRCPATDRVTRRRRTPGLRNVGTETSAKP
jgi:hypothetical protein